MKLTMLRIEETYGFELTFHELKILNHALSDYMIWLDRCLETHTVDIDQETLALRGKKKEQFKERLLVADHMKEMLELCVY